MIILINFILIGILMTDLILVSNSRLGTCIKILSVQGVILGLLPAVIGLYLGLNIELIVIAVTGIVLRGIVFPRLLHRSMVNTSVSRELKPYVGYFASVLVVIFLIIISTWISSRLKILDPQFSFITPVALTTIFTGTFLIAGRKIAVMQIIGYILLENGIYCLSLILVDKVPLIVEMGVLLDAFVAVFVMSVATNKIHEEFEHLDVQNLDSLKG